MFGLIPLEFLDGHKLKKWKGPVWAAVWACGLALFVHVLLGKFVKEVRDPAIAVVAASAFLAFGALSAGFWLAARRGSASGHRPRTAAPPLPVESGAPAIRVARRLGWRSGSRGPCSSWWCPGRSSLPGWCGLGRPAPASPRYAATVDVDTLRVRVDPSTGRPQLAVLQRGRAVDIRCAVITPEETWYRLLDPNPGSYVSGVGLSFPDGTRPPHC